MEIFKKIRNQIENNKTIVYIKGTPENPMCGFSSQVIGILNRLKIEYSYVDVIRNTDIRQHLPEYSKWPTFPQLFHKEELVGGCDVVVEMYKNGELEKLLK